MFHVTTLAVATATDVAKNPDNGHWQTATLIGFPIFGYCEQCDTELQPFQSYPARSGMVRCKDHRGEDCFATMAAFTEWCFRETEKKAREVQQHAST